MGEIYADTAQQLGHSNLSAQTLNESFLSAWKRQEDFDYSLPAWRKLVEETFLSNLSVSPALFQALYERFAEPSAWRIYDDVRPALQSLRERGFRLAVISNWDNRLRGLLLKLQLAAYFQSIVLSVDIGRTKPAAEVFQQTLRLLSLQPSEVLHVGDSAEEDLAGARTCGMHAVLLSRRVARPNCISTLAELLDLPLLS